MPTYRVNHRYSARRDGQDFGPYIEGSTVELTEDDAAWVNRDSEGVLSPLVEEAPAPAEVEKAPEPPKATKADRQHRGGQRRGW